MAGFSSGVAAMLVSAVMGGMGLPLGVPPATEDPTMGRVAPEQCLFYLSWAGTASPDPKSKNQTEQLLAEPEVQEFLKSLPVQRIYRAAADTGKQEKESELLQKIANHPGAVFVTNIKPRKPSEKKPAPKVQLRSGLFNDENAAPTSPMKHLADTVEGGCVFALGDDAASAKKIVEEGVRLWNDAAKDKPGKSGGVATVVIDGRKWYRGQDVFQQITFGFHGSYFIIAIGENGVENILARMNKEPPRWWTDIRKQLPVERRSLTLYADLQALRKLAASQVEPDSQKNFVPILEMLGLANARAWIEVWGLDGRDFANKSLLLLDGEPQGLLGVMTDRPLKPENAAAIPADAAFGTAFRFDPQKAMDVIMAATEKMAPKTKKAVTGQFDEWEKTLGIDLRHGTLKSMGDTWCVYASPSEGNLFITGMTAVVPLKDWAGMNVAYGRLMGMAKQWKPNQETAAVPPGSPSPQERVPIQSYRFADNDIYCYPVVQALLAPTWCMTKREMIFTMSPQNMKAYLTRDDRHEPLSRRHEVAGLFSDKETGPAMFFYGDAPRAFETFYPIMNIYGQAILGIGASDNTDAISNGPFLIPSCPSITRHLGPTVATLRRRPDGVEFVSRGTIPLPSAPILLGLQSLSGLPLGPFCIIPAYSGDPERRTVELMVDPNNAVEGRAIPGPVATPAQSVPAPNATPSSGGTAPAWVPNPRPQTATSPLIEEPEKPSKEPKKPTAKWENPAAKK